MNLLKWLLVGSLLLNAYFAYKRFQKAAPKPSYKQDWIETKKLVLGDTGGVYFIGNSIVALMPEFTPMVNLGISGSITSETMQTVDIALQRKPSKVFIMEGINDLRRGIAFDTVLSNYKKIVQKLQGTEYYILSVLPSFRDGDLPIKRLNDSLRLLGNYIDLYEKMNDPSLYYDGLHPNAKGYQVIISEITTQRGNHPPL